MKAPDSIVALEPRHFVYASSDRGSYGPHYREIPVRESVDSKEYTSDCVQSSEGCEARINSWICVLYAYPFRHIELRIIQKSILEAIRFILQQNKNTQSFHSNTVNMLYSFSLHSDVFSLVLLVVCWLATSYINIEVYYRFSVLLLFVRCVLPPFSSFALICIPLANREMKQNARTHTKGEIWRIACAMCSPLHCCFRSLGIVHY